MTAPGIKIVFWVVSVLLILKISNIQTEDVNKNIPLHCEYVNDDVTYMKCQNIGIDVYTMFTQLQNLTLEERSRVTRFFLYRVDMPAFRSRTFAMFPNLKRLELKNDRTYACTSDALQGIPQLEELWFDPGTSSLYHLDGLFDNLNLKWVKFGYTIYGMESVDVIFKSLKQNKLEYFEAKGWHMPWANLTGWFQGEYLKTLTLTALNTFFDLSSKPIDNPDYFSSFTHLETLKLSNNRISEIADGAFRSQTKLKTIDLSRNWLRKVSPGMFEGLDVLTKLDLSSNLFVVLSINDFGDVWYTAPVLTVNLRNNPFDCGCNMTEYAQGFNNMGYQLIANNFKCASPAPLKNKYVMDAATINSNLTTPCAPPVLDNCCPIDNTVIADWSLENKVTVSCKATGVPAPKILCEPISGNPMPKESLYYWEEEKHNSYVVQWFHAMVNDSGKIRCTAVNLNGMDSMECMIVVRHDWSSGNAVTPGGVSVLFAVLSAMSLFA